MVMSMDKKDNHRKDAQSRHISKMDALTSFMNDQGITVGPKEWVRAKDVVGRKARARLAWALQFAQQDPTELTSGELLDDRLRLRAFTRPEWVMDEPIDLFCMPNADSVAMARREIANILLPLKPGQSCSIKIELTLFVSCSSADGPPMVGFMDKTGGAVTRFVDLLNEYRSELRRCGDPKCRHWFVGRPNKAFCSTTCLSRMTTERLRAGRK